MPIALTMTLLASRSFASLHSWMFLCLPVWMRLILTHLHLDFTLQLTYNKMTLYFEQLHFTGVFLLNAKFANKFNSSRFHHNFWSTITNYFCVQVKCSAGLNWIVWNFLVNILLNKFQKHRCTFWLVKIPNIFSR